MQRCTNLIQHCGSTVTVRAGLSFKLPVWNIVPAVLYYCIVLLYDTKNPIQCMIIRTPDTTTKKGNFNDIVVGNECSSESPHTLSSDNKKQPHCVCILLYMTHVGKMQGRTSTPRTRWLASWPRFHPPPSSSLGWGHFAWRWQGSWIS